MNDLYSPFRIEQNKIVDLQINQYDNFFSFENITVDFGVDYKIANMHEENDCYTANIELLFTINGIAENKEKVFFIKLIMLGLFRADSSELSQAEFKEMLKINGVATLIQLGRSYVTAMTALSGFREQINLPMINVFELNEVKEIIESEEITD